MLRTRGLWEAIRPQLVLGDTIAQAAQFATTGNAVGGMLAYSLVLGPGFRDRGTYALIPESDHPPLRRDNRRDSGVSCSSIVLHDSMMA